MRVRTPAGETVVVHPKVGGLQGDAVMAPMFSAMYDPYVHEWVEWKQQRVRGRELDARDPYTGRVVSLGTTLYADDVAEINLTRDAEEMVERLTNTNEQLDWILGGLGMAQNRGKMEHVPYFKGIGATRITMEAERQLRERALGKFQRIARYLGNMKEADGKTKVNVAKHIDVMRENYYSLQHFWYAKDIRKRVKKMVFGCYVYNAGLAGLEAECLDQSDFEELDKMVMKLLRKVAGEAGSWENEQRNAPQAHERTRETML